MKRVLSAALAAGLSGAALLGLPGVASAAPACTKDYYPPIAARLGTLNAKLHDLRQHSPLTPSDAQALTRILNSDICGLTQLNGRLYAATSKLQRDRDQYDVYQDFLVYLLVGPQYSLSSTADAGAKAASDLQAEEPSLLKDATTSPTQAEYRNLVLNVNTALKVLPGIGPSVLALTPSGNYQAGIATAAKDVAEGMAALNKAETDASLITS